MGLPSGRVALAGRGSRQPHSQGGGCSASPLLSEGRQPLSPGLNQPFPKGLHNVLYPTLSPVRTAPAGPDTAGGPPASAAGADGGTQSRAAARQHRPEVASGG